MANRTITQSAVQFNTDVDLAHQIVHGSNTVVVQTEGGPVSSFSKIIGDVQNALNTAVVGVISQGVLTAALNAANIANAAANSATISANVAVNAATYSQDIANQFGNLTVAVGIATTQANLSQFYAQEAQDSANSAAANASSITSLLSFSPAPNKIPQADGSGQFPPTWVAGALVSSNNLSDIGNVQVAKTNLMLGNVADQNSSAISFTGGTIDGVLIGTVTPAFGKFTSINVTGNIMGANVIATNVFYGNIQTAYQPLITSLGTLSNLTVAGTGTFGSIVSNTTITGNLTTPVQANITTLGTLTALQVNGYSDFFQRATFVVQTQDTTHGAVEISGNGDGSFQTPYNTGVMLQNTGQPDIVSRVYIDGQGNYPVVAGRRYNGNTAVPTGIQTSDIMFRVAATPYTAEGWPQTTNISSPRMDFIASEPQHLNALGSRIEFWVNPLGANTVSKIVTIDSGSGVTATRFTGPVVGDVAGNIAGLVQTSAQPFITSVGTLTSLIVSGSLSSGAHSATSLTTANAQITGGAISNAPISGSTGSFTTLSASGGITGTLQTASQPNVTTVGNLTSLSVGGVITNFGGIYLPTVLKSGSYNVTTNDYTIRCDASGASFTVTLPSGPGLGQILNIKKVDTTGNTITIAGNGKNIDGSASATLSVPFSTLTMQYNGTNWDIL